MCVCIRHLTYLYTYFHLNLHTLVMIVYCTLVWDTYTCSVPTKVPRCSVPIVPGIIINSYRIVTVSAQYLVPRCSVPLLLLY